MSEHDVVLAELNVVKAQGIAIDKAVQQSHKSIELVHDTVGRLHDTVALLAERVGEQNGRVYKNTVKLGELSASQERDSARIKSVEDRQTRLTRTLAAIVTVSTTAATAIVQFIAPNLDKIGQFAIAIFAVRP